MSEKILMSEILREKIAQFPNYVEKIVGNIYTILPGDRIKFVVSGEEKEGVLETKSGMWWRIKGDDGQTYLYQTVVRVL